jgi:hypothetical protein
MNPEDKLPEWFTDKILSNVFQIEEIAKQKMVEACSNAWNPKKWIIPSTMSGNDGLVLGKILILTGEKVSLESPSVPTDEVANNLKKTGLEGLYVHETRDQDKIKKNEAKRKTIIDAIRGNEIHGIIRIHFILPKAAKPNKKNEEKNSFFGGIRVQRNGEFNVDEVIIDLDRTNLQESGIFSAQACEFLLDQLKGEKKRGRKPKNSAQKRVLIEEEEDMELF